MKLQTTNTNKKMIKLKRVNSKESKIDPEFMKWLDEFNAERGDALRELASK